MIICHRFSQAADTSFQFCQMQYLDRKYRRDIPLTTLGLKIIDERSLNARALLRSKQDETVSFSGTSLSGNYVSPSHELRKVREPKTPPLLLFDDVKIQFRSKSKSSKT